MTVSVEETLCACWKGWYKWLTVHFLDDLKYVVILNHGNWHSHEYVRFKNSQRESSITSLDSRVQDMTYKLETLLVNSKKNKVKSNVVDTCQPEILLTNSQENKWMAIWYQKKVAREDWFGQYT